MIAISVSVAGLSRSPGCLRSSDEQQFKSNTRPSLRVQKPSHKNYVHISTTDFSHLEEFLEVLSSWLMLDLEAQKLVVDGKLRCWLDIDVNDSRASYQRAVDFVGAKNLTCACAEI